MNAPATINTALVAQVEAEAHHLNGHRKEQEEQPASKTFPLEALPEGWRQIVEHLHQTLGFPIDYTASAMLFAASVAIGTSARITPKHGWYEYAILWMVLVGRPGANKTHPLAMMLRALYKKDRQSIEAFDQQMRDHQQEVNRIKNAKRAKGEPPEEFPAEPVCVQYLVSDTTPEALVEALNRSERGIGLHRDELSGWVQDFGKYNGGGEVQAYLSIWSAQTVKVNRVKNKRPISVDRPFVSVCGTIQPGVLSGLTADGRGENGFIDRLLFAYPEAQGMPEWTEAEPSPEALVDWSYWIDRLFSIPTPEGEAGPYTLRLSPEALVIWKQYHERIRAEVNRLNIEGDEMRAGQRTKMISYTLRLALVHTLASWAEGAENVLPAEVDPASLSAAISLAEYFTSTTDKVLYTIHDSTAADRLTGDHRELYEALPDEFKTSEAIVHGEGLGMSSHQVKKRLNRWKRERLINKGSHGHYSKLIEL